MNRRLLRLNLAVIIASGILAAAPVWGAQLGIVPQCAIDASKNQVPNLACAVQTFGNIAQIILGLVGGLTLLMFVYAGFTLLISGGDPGKVTTGKTILKNSLIGLAIVFSSGVLLNYAMSRIVANKAFRVVGASCVKGTEDATGSGQTDPNGKGLFIMMPDGKIVCAESCSSLQNGNIKYDCLTEKAPGAGITCLSTPDCAQCCPTSAGSTTPSTK